MSSLPLVGPSEEPGAPLWVEVVDVIVVVGWDVEAVDVVLEAVLLPSRTAMKEATTSTATINTTKATSRRLVARRSMGVPSFDWIVER